MQGGRRQQQQFKTKMCILYMKGRCSRPNCNFAHGEAELRRFSGGGGSSFNGRRDFRSSDLRDKLDRRHSPIRRYSPERDARSYHAFRGQKPHSRERGSSRSRSPGRKSERGHRRKVDVDGERDGSESRKISDGAEDLRREDKVSEYDEKYALEEQLKQLQSDIERLEDDKSQLQHVLEEKVDDAHKLSSKIQDLEFQLSKEQEDCKRITSKIKRFVRAHGHYLKAQEELKRTQARLQRLGNQLGSDILKPGATEEDSSVNVFSDGEPNGDDPRSRNKELKNDIFSVKKRPDVLSATSEKAKVGKFEGNLQKKRRYSGLIARSENIIQSEGPAHHLGTDDTETESKKAIQHKKEADKSLSDDYKHKRGRTNSSNTKLKRVKSSEAGRVLPSTSIAAHAVDDLIEAVEMEDKSEPKESYAYESRVSERKANSISMPPPPPPIDLNAYRQQEGNDEDVDVEIVENEMLDIDLNSEVDVEQ